jgi:hypothetical protein
MRPIRILISATVLALGATTFAGAQSAPATPAPIVLPTLPPDTPNGDLIRAAVGIAQQILQNQRIRNANNAAGTVTYFRRYEMQIQNGTNSYRTIHLHPGTVINPRGATPGVGTSVSVSGLGQSDGSLAADTITLQQ